MMNHKIHPYEMLRKIAKIEGNLVCKLSSNIYNRSNGIKSIRHNSRKKVGAL